MRGIANPKVSKGFVQEIYEKEVRIQLDFVSKHKEFVRSTSLFKGEPKNYEHTNININRAQVVAELDIIRDHVSSEVHRKPKAPAPTKFTRKEEHVDKLTKNIQVQYAQAVADMAVTKSDRMPARRRMKAPVEYNKVTANDIRTGDQVMRPIDKPTRELITEGSKEYFKKRHQMKPEEKYYYPQSTNWQYGWKLKDSLIKMNGPEHARVHLLGVSAYPKVGMQPDPWYYGNPSQLTSVRLVANC